MVGDGDLRESEMENYTWRKTLWWKWKIRREENFMMATENHQWGILREICDGGPNSSRVEGGGCCQGEFCQKTCFLSSFQFFLMFFGHWLEVRVKFMRKKLVKTSTFWRNECMRPNHVVNFRLFAGNVSSGDICQNVMTFCSWLASSWRIVTWL